MSWVETPAELFRANLIKQDAIGKTEETMSENELIRKGFEEAGIELEEYDMCQACSDAVAVDRARGYRVCRDCYYEMGV